MKTWILPLLLVGLTSLSARAAGTSCPSPWICEGVDVAIRKQQSVRLRAGYLEASAAVPFRGNILYLEGLADSILNHLPLFQQLTAQGYRVIAFDYPGQGGSEGSMNDTRIAWIPVMGDQVWTRFARESESFPRRTWMGWSTGGLAAYMAAHEGRADRVILIAPGIEPTAVVRITLKSLTSESSAAGKRLSDGAPEPHLDPISPTSPVQVPAFSIDLLHTAQQSHGWGISAQVSGLVLLSGRQDKYVDAAKTKAVLAEHAPHFRVVTLSGALHEIDNEVGPIRRTAIGQILKFLTDTQ